MACKGVQWLALAMLLTVGVALAQPEEAIKGSEPVKPASYDKQPFGIWSYDEGARYGDKGGPMPEGYDYGKAPGCANTCNYPAPQSCDCSKVGLGLVQCGTECVNPLTSNACCGKPKDPVEELKICEAPKICKNGECVCPEGWLLCDGQCFDPTSKDSCGTTCEDIFPCPDTEVCDNVNCRCPDRYISCEDGAFCYPDDTCPECKDPNPPACLPADQSLTDPNSCGTTCKKCRGRNPSCVEGECVSCIKNGENKGACTRNSDCCSCQCFVPSGKTDGQCKGSPKTNIGADSCETCKTCPFDEPSLTDPNSCGTTCKKCRGRNPSCVEGECVSCIKNGENKGACTRNSDCCSCQCFVPSGKTDGQCKGSPKTNIGADSCETCKTCPFDEPVFPRAQSVARRRPQTATQTPSPPKPAA